MLDPIYHALSAGSLGSMVTAALTWPKFSISSYAMARRLIAECGQLSTIIDIGANTGQFCVAASRTFPAAKIFSFEPNPASFERLVKTTARTSSISCRQLAIGDSEGQISLRINSHSHSSSVLPLAESHKIAFPSAREVGEVQVPVRTLDGLFCADITHQSLLKIDVQGYEMAVLRGARNLLPKLDFVVLEVSFAPLYDGESTFDEICEELRRSGMKLRAPVGWLRDPQSGKFIQMDALFCRS
ncbi:MAG: FkbM family methyltransferase [Burkholderiales bacterium]|jgi:FkbM family methyltransferase